MNIIEDVKKVALDAFLIEHMVAVVANDKDPDKEKAMTGIQELIKGIHAIDEKYASNSEQKEIQGHLKFIKDAIEISEYSYKQCLKLDDINEHAYFNLMYSQQNYQELRLNFLRLFADEEILKIIQDIY